MNRFHKGLGFAVALSFVVVACSSPIPDGSLAGGSQDQTKTPSKLPPSKTPAAPANPAPANPAPSDPSNPTPTPTPTPGADCSKEATGQACFTCCDTASGGELKKADDAFGACACNPGGQCTTACSANFCTGAAPTAACDTCLTNTCDPIGAAACTSAACKAGEQCLTASACNAKP